MKLRVLACLWLFGAAILPAQDRPPSTDPEPTFRTATQSVRVDLYATRNGEPLADLRQNEVQVFEDGVPQTIQTFERVTFATRGSGPVVEPKTPAESRRLATDPRSRLFVVFLTAPDVRLVGTQRVPAPSPVIALLNQLLGPDDVVAVMTPYMQIADMVFSRRLAPDLELWFREALGDPKQTLWDGCFPPGPGSPNGEMKARYRELITFEALEKLVTHLSGLRDQRTHVLIATDGFRLYTKNPRLPARGQPESGGGLPIGGGSGGIGIVPRLGDSAGMPTGRIPHECDQDLKDLASLDHGSRLEEIATYARRTNVSLYPISFQRTSSDRTRNLRLRGSFENNTTTLMQSSLRDLAEDTGGVPIVNTTNVESILRRIVATTSSYYLVGYTPANTTSDGRFRRISVKVSRPGTDIQARSGYVFGLPEPKTVMPVETRRPPDPVDLSMRALTISATSALHLRPAAWTRTDSSGARVTLWVVAELDPDVRRQRASAPGGTAQVTLRPLRGGDPISRQVVLADVGGPIEFEIGGNDGVIGAGEYSLQMEVTGADGKPIGEFVRLTLPESTSPLGDAVLLRRGATTGPRYVRTADPRFTRTDRLRLEMATDLADPATARLLDKRGGALNIPVQVALRDDAGEGFRWIVTDVPLLSLAPGDYAVEVTQGAASRVTAFRLVP
jgi:VWFA-related protein